MRDRTANSEPLNLFGLVLVLQRRRRLAALLAVQPRSEPWSE